MKGLYPMTKRILVGNVAIGGGAPIAIQSMCNVPFSRFDELVYQAKKLEESGCHILRVSVPDELSAKRFRDLRKEISIPLVADIHFDYNLALESIKAGADKIRINPGNIKPEGLKKIATAALKQNIPIRVGINAGSLEKDLLKKYGEPCAEALAQSAAKNVRLMEECGFYNIIVSMKASSVKMTVDAYRLYAEKFNTGNYPLHIGITEAGTARMGLIKSAIGLGALLLDGIGDTIRVSLAADPVEEIYAAKSILRAAGIDKSGLEVISCPTCGRTTINSIQLAEKIEREFSYIRTPIKIAVMGCVVNGIGESAQADFGITGEKGEYLIFKGKKVVRRVSENEIMDVVKDEINQLANRKL